MKHTMQAMSSLYLDYFGLTSPPFSITPDPGFFFEGEDRGVFMAGLLHAALQAEGIVLVIGEVGSGKTLMSRILLSRLPDYVDTVYLPNPAFSHDEIIDVIARDLGIAPASHQGVRLEALQHELIRRYAQGRQVVVFIDEAHTMPGDSIEEVRRLSNLETDNRKLVQLILCGQPELDTLLAAPSLRQVRDRVVYRLRLRNLSRADASSYLDHRLRIAGWRGGRMFSRLGERLLLGDARGRARRLNLVADKALLAAFAEGKRQVSARHVWQAIQDAGSNFASLSFKPHYAWLLALTVCALICLYLLSRYLAR
jgi:type II secretory pathway predicted ATPase ExeA